MREDVVETKTVENFVVGDPDGIPRFEKDGDVLSDVDWTSVPGLADLIVDPKAGRGVDEEVTLFLERGLGVQFLATGLFVYERALEEGLGTRLHAGPHAVTGPAHRPRVVSPALANARPLAEGAADHVRDDGPSATASTDARGRRKHDGRQFDRDDGPAREILEAAADPDGTSPPPHVDYATVDAERRR